MLNLAEYRSRAGRLADHLPWAALVAPGVVLNKDGSFQRTIAFRGPDMESATEAELVSISARANNVLKRFGSGWALFFEAERREASSYPESRFPDAASWLVDEERRAAFLAEGSHFESRYFLTLCWLPPADSEHAAGRALIERGDEVTDRNWRDGLASYLAETDRAIDLFGGFLPEVRPLGSAETLTYLHGAISDRRHQVAVPETPMYLDGLLVDVPLTGGLEPRLGGHHLRTLTVLGFPNVSRPGLLDALNHQDFAYRWVTRFIALDKVQATKTLNRLFELGLGEVAMALCGASGPVAQARIDAQLARHGCDQFLARFLAGSGIAWAGVLIADFEQRGAAHHPFPHQGEPA